MMKAPFSENRKYFLKLATLEKNSQCQNKGSAFRN